MKKKKSYEVIDAEESEVSTIVIYNRSSKYSVSILILLKVVELIILI